MKRFCEKISRFLLDVDNVTEDEIDEVRFGIELILTQMILFFLLLAIGIFRNMVLETIIFIIALVGLRTFVDGYHADSFYRCMFLTTLLYLGTLYFADFENSYLLIMAILIAAKAFMWQENHEARNVKISKLIFWGCLAVIGLIYPIEPRLSMIIGFTLFFTGVSMEVKKHGYKEKVVSLVKKVSKKYADNYSPGGMYKPTRNKK